MKLSLEPLLLREATRTAATRSPAQDEAVARCHALGRSQLRAAQSVLAEDVAPRLVLLRAAALCFIAAAGILVEEALEPGDLDAASAWALLSRLVDEGACPPLPPHVLAARRWLVAQSPVDVPRSAGEANDALAVAFPAVRWLSRRVDPRSVKALRRARRARVAALVTGVLASLGCIAAVVLAPENLALGKTVVASSKVEVTTGTPQGLTNGVVEFSFGTETDVEDSPWFLVDLGGSRRVGKVVVYNRGDRNPDDNLPLVIEVGNSRDALHPVGRTSRPFTRTRPWEVRGLHESARYVRVRKTTRGALFLSEIEVYP